MVKDKKKKKGMYDILHLEVKTHVILVVEPTPNGGLELGLDEKTFYLNPEQVETLEDYLQTRKVYKVE